MTDRPPVAVVDADLTTLRRRSLPAPNGAPSARSLLLTILGEYVLPADEPVWSSTLLGALEALGVQQKTARQAISRSSADGWLIRERVGRRVRWQLTDQTRALLQEGAERIYSFRGATADWDGRWLLVRVSVPEDRREQRHHVHSRLAWAGFASLGQGLWVSPHPDRRDELLDALDLADDVDEPMTFVTEPRSDEEDQALVAAAWGDRTALTDAYAAFLDSVDHQDGSAPTQFGGAGAFVAQTRMVHEWRKFPFMDPALPVELLPADWIGARAAEVFAAHHRCWSKAARRWFGARNAEG